MAINNSPLPLRGHWQAAMGAETGTTMQEIAHFIHHEIRPHTTKENIANGTMEVFSASHHHDVFIFLNEQKKIVAAFPALKFDDTRSERLQFELSKIIPHNDYEATLVGGCKGVTLNIFDTAYYFNRSKYQEGSVYDFWVGALAYKIEKSGDHCVTQKDGSKRLSMGRSSTFLMPPIQNTEKRYEGTEFAMRGPVLKVEKPLHQPYSLNRFRAKIAHQLPHPIDPNLYDEIRMDIYGLPKAIVGDQPTTEDALFALAWVQGKLATG